MRKLLLTGMLLVAASAVQASEVDRLYVIDCGWAHDDDQSRLSPGVNVGVPMDISDNCYLIHHRTAGYLLWDTGIFDRVVALPDGLTIKALGRTWHRTQTLAASLAALGVKPADVRYVALSHTHPDHTGNVSEFPDATIIIQKAEWEYGLKLPLKPFSSEQKTELLEGDKDLFGDGSVTALSTPGHTPGHQSLLVHLERTGYVVLSGDVAHFQSNWDNRRVPDFNADQAQSKASMEKIAHILEEKHARFWINHDKPSSDARRHAPEFYD
jgi:N-acyl homoserine lactone hydrolase